MDPDPDPLQDIVYTSIKKLMFKKKKTNQQNSQNPKTEDLSPIIVIFFSPSVYTVKASIAIPVQVLQAQYWDNYPKFKSNY